MRRKVNDTLTQKDKAMAKYLDPKADVTFKKVFGEHKNLVISLLNSLLPLDKGKQVESIEYLPPELVPRTPIDKDTSVDVRCEETGGRKFIVEMQMSWTASFKQRVLFNASKAYVKQLEKGEVYASLQPVYSLNLVNHTIEPELDDYYHYYRMVHYLHSNRVLDGLHLVFVELPKFKAKNLAEKKMQVLWLRFLTEIGRDGADEVSQDLLDNPQTGQALEIVRESAYSKEEMAAYDGFWDYVSRRKGELAELERKAKELERAAKELERAAGAVRARDAAIAERDAEKARADAATAERDAVTEKLRQTARNLKAMSLSVEQIATATGLTADEIKAL